MDTQSTIDVLVIGAGPVGLFLASLLKNYGHSVRIIEKDKTPNQWSKALNVNTRTLEMMEFVGCVEEVLGRGCVVRGPEVWVGGKMRVSLSDTVFPAARTKYPYLFSCPQTSVEDALRHVLESRGLRVETGHDLVVWSQTEHHVRAMVKQEGVEGLEEISCKYLVGCDGAHSAVRKSDPSWNFVGRTVEGTFEQADCELEVDDTTDMEEFHRIRISLCDDGLVFRFPVDPAGRIVRLVCNVGQIHFPDEKNASSAIRHGRDTAEESPVLADFERLCNSRHANIKIKSATWLTRFHVNERMVETLRKGRVFLAGDAAHCHSPAGGMGMNTGLQDAMNLGWKLSMALHKTTNNENALLDSYNQERLPIIRTVLDNSSDLLRLVVDTSLTKTVFLYLLTTAFRFFPSLRLRALERLTSSQLRLPNASGPPGTAINEILSHDPLAGSFCPNVVIYPESVLSKPQDLHTVIADGMRMLDRKGPRHTLLVLVHATTLHESFNRSLATIRKGLDSIMSVLLIMSPGGCSFQGSGFPGHFTRHMKDILGARQLPAKEAATLLLVRPDLYLAGCWQCESDGLSIGLVVQHLAKSVTIPESTR